MTREGLEAVAWEHAPGLAAPRAADRCAAMKAILAAADDYATTQCAIALRTPGARTEMEHPAEQARHRAVLLAALRQSRRAP